MRHVYLFDIDGTIYDNKFHQVDPELLLEFDYLLKQGHKIFLVSSRSPYEMVHLPKTFIHFPFSGMVLEGGAAIFDEKKNLIDARLIPNERVKKVRDYCKENNIFWRYSGPDGNFFNSHADKDIRQEWRKLYMVAPQVKEWMGDDVCNLLIWTADAAHKSEIKNIFPENALVYYDECIEVRAKYVSKEDALADLRDRFAPCKIIAVGDGENDIEMIKNADYGVATGNGCTKVKEIADEVIGAVSENGVTSWLKQNRERSNKLSQAIS